MKSLVQKEKQSNSLIRSFAKKHGIFELCYSGGKDSDVKLDVRAYMEEFFHVDLTGVQQILDNSL